MPTTKYQLDEDKNSRDVSGESPRPALEGDPWPAEIELDHAISRYISERGGLVRPDVVDWLKGQCSRRMYGQCTTARCLNRGGYQNNPPFSPDIATCEPHEILSAIGVVEVKDQQ